METIKADNFAAFPISDKTKNGLFDAGYKHPTQIQKDSVGIALKGFDVVGAAKTGSGKTLAFVLPLLELLEREKWTKVDGLGALIITPTRELAYQIFEVVKKVGKYHDFSLGLVIGGKDLKFEWNRLHVCNIMITTPGRLLDHMDRNHFFNADNLKLLVLDEADRMLDMGFAQTMNAILSNLPKQRQTLLFSATPNKSVKDLARINLKSPVYVSVHENSDSITPEHLVQSYVVTELHDKLNILWSFLKSHLHNKIIVFFSTRKQTNFAYELFRQMKLKTTLLSLYGTLHQLRRMDVYDEFCRKPNAVLFATDIVSRGLDFPDVNWVVQFDCPEDTNAYVHRVGRTARYKKGGESLLFLLPSEEESMIERLKERKIPINKIEINPSRVKSIQQRAAAMCASDTDLKARAQRCFQTYLKSYHLMKDKSVFDLTAIDFEAYAHSLGLEVSPRLRRLEKDKVLNEKMKQIRMKNQTQTVAAAEDEQNDALSAIDLVQPSTSDAGQTGPQDRAISVIESNDEDDLLVLKRKVPIDDEPEDKTKPIQHTKRPKVITKEAKAKKLIKRNIVMNTKKRFYGDSDDDLSDAEYDFAADFNLDYAKDKLQREDEKDKKAYRAVIRKRTMDSKMRAKMELIEQMEEKAKRMGVKLSGKEEENKEDDDKMDDDDDRNVLNQEDDGEEESQHESESDRQLSSDDDQSESQLKTEEEMVRTQKFIDDLPDPDELYN